MNDRDLDKFVRETKELIRENRSVLARNKAKRLLIQERLRNA